MASEVFNLAILLSLKDAASGGLDRFDAKLRAVGKDGKHTLETLDNIRGELNKGLALAGIGITGLGLLKKGVDAAGDFQSAMTELRTTLAVNSGGSLNLEQLGKDMRQAESIAVKLGNTLPGTTEDFISMIQTLKQGGVDTKTIFDGAAESVANLAVANNAVPKEIAKDFAKFGQIYKLKPEEYKGVADIFSRIYTSKGIESGELIESAKYFQGRAGNALGLTGLKGAEDSVRLLSYLQKQGLESRQAGTSASTFLVQAAKNKKALEEIRQEYGITLDLFDKKGEFKGLDNAFHEFQKFQKLNPEQRLVALNKLGGEEGSMAGTAIVSGGIEGWKQFNAEVNQSISLTDKTAMKAADYNNKMEALSGTLTNLKVTVFEPMLPTLSSAAEKANVLVGAIQGFAKEHSTITGTVVGLAALGSTALVVVGGVKAMSSAWKIWRLISTFSKSDSIIAGLQQTQTQTLGVSAGFDTATTKAKGFRGVLSSIGNSKIVSLGLNIAAIYGLEQAISQTIQSYLNAREAERGKADAIQKNSTVFESAVKDPNISQENKQNILKSQAQTNLFALRQGGMFRALGLEKADSYGAKITDFLSTSPGAHRFFGANRFMDTNFGYDRKLGVEKFRSDAPTLGNPSVMREFLKLLPERIPGNDAQSVKAREEISKTAQLAFPESFTTAMRELSGITFAPLTQSLTDLSTQMNAQVAAQTTNTELYNQQGQTLQTFGQNLTNLQQPLTATNQNIFDLGNTTNKANAPINRLATSANSVASSLDSVSDRMANWQPPIPQVQTYQIGIPQNQTAPATAPIGTPFNIFGKASGGTVKSDGLAYIHAGEDIVPADITKQYRQPQSLSLLSQISNASFANSVSNDVTSRFNLPQKTSENPTVFLPSRAVGGNDGRNLSKLRQTDQNRAANIFQNIRETSSAQNSPADDRRITINYSPNVTINGGDKKAKDDFRAMLNQHVDHIGNLVARKLQNGRVRA